MLPDYDLYEVLEWSEKLVVPAAHFTKLHNAEIEKEGLQLWFEHVQNIVLIASSVAYCLQVIELEPEGHYFVVEVGARLDELYVEV